MRIIVQCRDCGLSKRASRETVEAVVHLHAVTNPVHTVFLTDSETRAEL